MSRKLPRPWFLSFFFAQNVQQNLTSPISTNMREDSKNRNNTMVLSLPAKENLKLSSILEKMPHSLILQSCTLPVYMLTSLVLSWEQLDASFWPVKWWEKLHEQKLSSPFTERNLKCTLLHSNLKTRYCSFAFLETLFM